MNVGIVPLNPEHLDKLLNGAAPDLLAAQLHRAYFSPGSVSCCLMSEGEPVFAGGIVNMAWNRGEAWLLPTAYFKRHVKTCLRAMREDLPRMAERGRFRRIQATCVEGISPKLFRHLGFQFEGIVFRFGPNGENCRMYSRLFEVEP